jgi:heme/copper-type cytochrome/quinol oxidase subunit 3
MAATATAPQPTPPAASPEPNRGPLAALGLPPAPEPRRRNTMVVGMLFAGVAGIMLMAGLLAGYFDARAAATAGNQPWPPEDVNLPNVPLLVTYVTLLASTVTAQWAVHAIRIGARRHMYVAIGLTLTLGLCFVNALSFCWTQLELVAGESAYANTVYAVTVGHLLFVIAAHVVFVVMGFRALGGHFTPRNAQFVAAAAAFWHVAAAAGVLVWWSLWFLEGGPGS